MMDFPSAPPPPTPPGPEEIILVLHYILSRAPLSSHCWCMTTRRGPDATLNGLFKLCTKLKCSCNIKVLSSFFLVILYMDSRH